MIPTAIIAGMIVGRWWAAPVIGAVWTLWIAVDVACDVQCISTSFGLASINGAIGILIHKAIRAIFKWYHGGDSSTVVDTGSDE